MSFSTVLVDEWARAGVTDAVVSPGSRSTPLVVALAADPRLQVHVVLDERSASYTALGLALASGRPTVLTCTSGTAGTHFHGAVVEADQAGVPLIVCTADRPPELQGVGAPQTIEQADLYGGAVRWAANDGVPDASTAATWRSLAARAVCEAVGNPPGPVHLNLAFREPLLEGSEEPTPAGRPAGAPWHRPPVPPEPATAPGWLVSLLEGARRPLVVAGAGTSPALRLDGVPVLADHRAKHPAAVAHWDPLLRDPAFRDAHAPDLVLRTGMPPASKVLATWLSELDAPQVHLDTGAHWIDPAHTALAVFPGAVEASLSAPPGWASSWVAAGATAAGAIETALAGHREPTEPGVARAVFATRPAGSTLVVSSSMPVRDLEWFAAPRDDVRVLANRGANGIDGVTSTALGVALTGAPTTLLIGDLAFLHDAGALLGLARHPVDLTIVVVDNDGGGIFSFLPQHGALPADRFEALFGTPHGIDLAELCGAHGLPSTTASTAADVGIALEAARRGDGVRVVVVRTDRSTNVALHDELNEAVAAALAAVQPPR